MIATIYVAISVPLNASFHGQTCCYHGNGTYLSSLDTPELKSIQAMDDDAITRFSSNTYNLTSIGNQQLKKHSISNSSTQLNRIRRKRGYAAKPSSHMMKERNNQSVFSNDGAKRNQPLVSSMSDQPSIVRV